jgi:hypothetical protein
MVEVHVQECSGSSRRLTRSNQEPFSGLVCRPCAGGVGTCNVGGASQLNVCVTRLRSRPIKLANLREVLLERA